MLQHYPGNIDGQEILTNWLFDHKVEEEEENLSLHTQVVIKGYN